MISSKVVLFSKEKLESLSSVAIAYYYAGADEAYLEYLHKSVEILCTQYGKIGGFWFDGNWDKPDADWKLDELYGTIRKHQPDAMIINNTGLNARGELGHPEIDAVTYEQGRPEPLDRSKADFSVLSDEASADLVARLEAFPQVVQDAAEKYEPSIITRYCANLAQSYNRFYFENRIFRILFYITALFGNFIVEFH